MHEQIKKTLRTMPELNTNHDKLFKSAFQDIKSAREFLENEKVDELFLQHDNKNLAMKAGVGIAAK